LEKAAGTSLSSSASCLFLDYFYETLGVRDIVSEAIHLQHIHTESQAFIAGADVCRRADVVIIAMIT